MEFDIEDIEPLVRECASDAFWFVRKNRMVLAQDPEEDGDILEDETLMLLRWFISEGKIDADAMDQIAADRDVMDMISLAFFEETEYLRDSLSNVYSDDG